MRQWFYQANFCAECGNELKAKPIWWSRYFCTTCVQQHRRRSFRRRVGWSLAVLCGLLGWVYVGRPSTPPIMRPAPATVTAFDATARMQLPPPPPPEPARTFCGARTRRGTPCRRLVPSGQRCLQHHGQPSLIKE